MKFTRGNTGNDDGNNPSNKKSVNKKGVILTSTLVAGIIVASFLAWLLPSGNNGSPVTSNMTVTFLDPNLTLTSVKSQFGLLKEEVENQVDPQRVNQTQNTSSFDSFVAASIKQNEELMRTLSNGNPDQGLLPQYLTLMGEMKNYSIFLSNLKSNTSG